MIEETLARLDPSPRDGLHRTNSNPSGPRRSSTCVSGLIRTGSSIHALGNGPCRARVVGASRHHDRRLSVSPSPRPARTVPLSRLRTHERSQWAIGRGAHVAGRSIAVTTSVLPSILQSGENKRGNRKRELWILGQHIGVQAGPNSKPYTPIVARFFREPMNWFYTHPDRCPSVSCRRDHLRYICRPASPVPSG